jgi:glyoxylase-like metal-dependent hydrolase (beta-lactamase superfamily II)
VAPDEIDIVVNTHLHFDHCGWNTMRLGDRVVPTFPKAKYYVQEGEWRHAQQQHVRDAISYISDNYNPLIESGQMQLLRGDQEIVPGLSVRVFPGHTMNMQAVVVTSGGKTACYISDLIPTSAHIDLTWVMAFDLSPIDTIDSKKRYYSGLWRNAGWLYSHATMVRGVYREGRCGKVVRPNCLGAVLEPSDRILGPL